MTFDPGIETLEIFNIKQCLVKCHIEKRNQEKQKRKVREICNDTVQLFYKTAFSIEKKLI